jgi:ubiquinone/menaquinone biosynthesis C-methylase UbiE
MMPGFDHFSHLAPFYDRAIPFNALDSLLEYGRFSATDLVLDAGGGTGRVATALKPYVRDVIIVDVSIGMLNRSNKKGFPATNSLVEVLPFSNEQFDRIIMIDALHHVLDQSAAAKELWRVLAPGGIIIIEEPDIRSFSVKLLAVGEKLALMRSHFISPPKIIDLFRPHTDNLEIRKEGTNSWITVER